MTKPLKVAILGYGNEGRAVLKYLLKNKQYKKTEFTVLDKSKNLSVPKGILKELGDDYLKNLSLFDIVFRSPGVHYDAPELIAARKKGVKFSSSTKLFFALCPAKIIGITGTKGKGTTSTLLFKILKAAKKDVYLGGNIGTPAIELLPKLKKPSLVILELSSFQLQDLDRSPSVAAVLEIFPDHQDAHKDLSEYYEAKSNVARHQTAKDVVFFFGDHPMSKKVAKPGKGKKMPVFPREHIEFDPEELKVRGAHNFRNAVLAANVARFLKIPKDIIIRVIKNFPGTEHRLEFVCLKNNISFFNDSASTNPQTSSAALKSFPGEALAIIMGGHDKGLDYEPLKKAVIHAKPRLIVLMGANREKINKTIAGCGAKIVFAKTLKEAVKLAYDSLKKIPYKGAVVLSPGAASFDMFKNYSDRGEQFKKIVRAL